MRDKDIMSVMENCFEQVQKLHIIENLDEVFSQVGAGSSIIKCDGVLHTAYKIADDMEHYFTEIEEVGIAPPYIRIRANCGIKILYDILSIDTETDAITYFGADEYIINCEKLMQNHDEEEDRFVYDNEEFFKYIIDIGNDNLEKNHVFSDYCIDLANYLFDELEDDNEEICHIVIDIEDRVLAIAIDQYIEDAKNVIGEILGLKKDIFIEVSGPVSTVLLIDCDKIVLRCDVFGEDVSNWLW